MKCCFDECRYRPECEKQGKQLCQEDQAIVWLGIQGKLGNEYEGYKTIPVEYYT